MPVPDFLWVKFEEGQAVEVATKDHSRNVGAFKEAVKAELPNKLGGVDPDDITLSLTKGGKALNPRHKLEDALEGFNPDNGTIFVTVKDTQQTGK